MAVIIPIYSNVFPNIRNYVGDSITNLLSRCKINLHYKSTPIRVKSVILSNPDGVNKRRESSSNKPHRDSSRTLYSVFQT